MRGKVGVGTVAVWAAALVLLLGVTVPSQTALAQSPTVVRYWLWLDDPTEPMFDQLVKEFNATHPGIKVEYQLVPLNETAADNAYRETLESMRVVVPAGAQERERHVHGSGRGAVEDGHEPGGAAAVDFHPAGGRQGDVG